MCAVNSVTIEIPPPVRVLIKRKTSLEGGRTLMQLEVFSACSEVQCCAQDRLHRRGMPVRSDTTDIVALIVTVLHTSRTLQGPC